MAGDEHETRTTFFSSRVEELLDHAQLAVPADERRLESVDALLTAENARRTDRLEELERHGLALELVGAGRLVGQRGARQRTCRVVDPHLAGTRDGLDARRGVDGISR